MVGGQPERIASNRATLMQSLEAAAAQAAASPVAVQDLERVGTQLASVFDPQNGGIGGAPKFPNPTVLEFASTLQAALLRYGVPPDEEAPLPSRLKGGEGGGLPDEISAIAQ